MSESDLTTRIGGLEPAGVLPVRSHVRIPGQDHRFYSPDRAFGRFGIRIFEPVTMDKPHWHGHIEANLAIAHEMTYDVDGTEIVVPPDRLVVFWAGVPHRLTAIRRVDDRPPKLCNIYLPLDDS